MTAVVIIAAALKIVLLALPLSVTLLAARRMILSETANAWLYGAVMLFAGVTAFGTIPWAIGFTPPSTFFLTLAALCPVVWSMVIAICGVDRKNPYEIKNLDERPKVSKTLVLTDPVGLPVPVFRRSSSVSNVMTQVTATKPSKVPPNKSAVTVRPKGRSVLAVAMDMRDGRKSIRKVAAPRLIAGPTPEATDLPFLPRSPSA